MAVERIYTLPELAELTGRDASFWASESSRGRLAYLRPDPGFGEVLVMDSDYDAWVSAVRGGPDRAGEPEDEVPAVAYLTKEQQEACLVTP
jgi:hypothetical protein